MISQYKSMVSNTNQSSTAVNGTFANDPIMLSFVENIKRKLSSGLIAGNGNAISLSNLGMDFQNDGTLKFNATKLSNFKDPHYSNVMEALGSGIHLGGVLDQSGSYISRSSLVDDLTNLLSPNGTLAVSIKMQNTDISNIQSKQQALSNQLSVLQASYTRQYSNLNALLFTLSQTSSQLTSSLTAVTNINSGK
jgi:flagellar hook-associated protein 2